jgi:exodeoxyribonuclease V alpha subunit
MSELSGSGEQVNSVISDNLCLLQKSYRFGQHSGIGQLAKAVNQSDLALLKQVWQQGYADICLYRGAEHSSNELSHLVVNGYQPYLKAAAEVSTMADVVAVLNLFNKFQLLSPLRQGKVGVDALNLQIESKLTQHQFINLTQGSWYVGRPVMVQQNDYQQQLFNGDVGIVLPDIALPDIVNPNSQQVRVYFKMADGEIKSFLPSRLPRVDTVYAMTIHKSQGSEFEHVVMVLPDTWSPLLTKELVYTGITRAKSRFDLFSSIAVLKKSTLSYTERSSGLSQLLKTV